MPTLEMNHMQMEYGHSNVSFNHLPMYKVCTYGSKASRCEDILI
jgi:hypothetical protein